MAVRYDQKTKDEVVAFVQRHNEEKGRGGQSAAMKKWKLSPLTVKAWLDSAGVVTTGRGKKKRKGVRGRPAASKEQPAAAKPSGDTVSSALQRMVEIKKEIAALDREFDKLKGKL